MNTSDLRAVLLLRAVESQRDSTAGSMDRATGPSLATSATSATSTTVPFAPPATTRAATLADGDSADPVADWAGTEARRRLGDQASPEAWLGERARLRLARLGEQAPAWRPVIETAAATNGRGGVALLLIAAALLGALGEQLGSSGVIPLLAPPLLGLLLWNLGVYALLAWQALRRSPAGRHRMATTGSLRGWLLGLAARGRTWLGTRGAHLDAPRAAAWARFQHDWLAHTGPWQLARGVALLHAGAAALAMGALASWYARGLVLDYRASWDSTFLDAGQVQLLLTWVLGPAAALIGQALPDTATLVTLRGADGGSEGAARWIHLWSLTVLGWVVLPRLALAAATAWQARRLARQWPLPDDDGLQRLLRSASGQPQAVLVLPYSYQLDPAREATLLQWLDAGWGPGLAARVQPSLALGAEDDLASHLQAQQPPVMPAAMPARVVVVFALTATPERESHGAFLRALALHRGAGAPPTVVLIDESGFRQRLAGATLAERLAQRRAAWQALLDTVGAAPLPARFVDLSRPPGPAPTP
jgi:Protein of unknown function (DUF2868)